MTSLLRSSASRSIYTSDSTPDFRDASQRGGGFGRPVVPNIEVQAEEQSIGELFVALQASMFDCVPEMKELGHPSQQLCR